MNLVLLVVAVGLILWHLPELDGSSPITPQQAAEKKQQHEYGLEASQKMLALHDDTESRLIEIHALELLEMGVAESKAEATEIATQRVNQDRQDILENIEIYRVILEAYYNQPRPVK